VELKRITWQLIVSVSLRHIDPLCLMLSCGQKESLSEIGNSNKQRMADNLRLKVATYNMHGLNQGSAFVEYLCEDHDVIFLQEHWLAPFDLSRLDSICSKMICFATSAVDSKISSVLLEG